MTYLYYKWKFVPFDPLHPFCSPPPSPLLAIANLFSVFTSYFFSFLFLRFHIQYLSSSVWHISLSIIRSVHVVTKSSSLSPPFSSCFGYSQAKAWCSDLWQLPMAHERKTKRIPGMSNCILTLWATDPAMKQSTCRFLNSEIINAYIIWDFRSIGIASPHIVRHVVSRRSVLRFFILALSGLYHKWQVFRSSLHTHREWQTYWTALWQAACEMLLLVRSLPFLEMKKDYVLESM